MLVDDCTIWQSSSLIYVSYTYNLVPSGTSDEIGTYTYSLLFTIVDVTNAQLEWILFFRFQKENATSLLLWDEILSVAPIVLKDEMDSW